MWADPAIFPPNRSLWDLCSLLWFNRWFPSLPYPFDVFLCSSAWCKFLCSSSLFISNFHVLHCDDNSPFHVQVFVEWVWRAQQRQKTLEIERERDLGDGLSFTVRHCAFAARERREGMLTPWENREQQKQKQKQKKRSGWGSWTRMGKWQSTEAHQTSQKDGQSHPRRPLSSFDNPPVFFLSFSNGAWKTLHGCFLPPYTYPLKENSERFHFKREF